MKRRAPAILWLALAAGLWLGGCALSPGGKTDSVRPERIYSLYGGKCSRMLQLLGNPTTIELTECIYELSSPENPGRMLTISVEIQDQPRVDFKDRAITGAEYRCRDLNKPLSRALEPELWQALKNASPPQLKTYRAGNDLGFVLSWRNLPLRGRVIPRVTLQGFVPQAAGQKIAPRRWCELLGEKGEPEIYREGDIGDGE